MEGERKGERVLIGSIIGRTADGETLHRVRRFWRDRSKVYAGAKAGSTARAKRSAAPWAGRGVAEVSVIVKPVVHIITPEEVRAEAQQRMSLNEQKAREQVWRARVNTLSGRKK